MAQQNRLHTEQRAQAELVHNRIHAQAAANRADVELKWKELWQPAQAPKLEEEIIVTVPTQSIIKESSSREGHKEAEEAIALVTCTVPKQSTAKESSSREGHTEAEETIALATVPTHSIAKESSSGEGHK